MFTFWAEDFIAFFKNTLKLSFLLDIVHTKVGSGGCAVILDSDYRELNSESYTHEGLVE